MPVAALEWVAWVVSVYAAWKRKLELAEHRRPWPRAEACVGERLGDLLARGGEPRRDRTTSSCVGSGRPFEARELAVGVLFGDDEPA